MKTGLAGMEVHHLLKELQFLIGGKIDKIYVPSKKELILQLHIPSKGTRQLKIDERSLYLTEHKSPAEEPSDFCLYLRKKLKNARLRKISQVGFERIIDFDFETKEGHYSLIFELFSKGNIILTKDELVLVAVEYKKWANRTLRPKQKYIPPTRENNALGMNLKELKKVISNSEKESLVKSLALDLGLGGVYAEEVCILSKVNKNKKPEDVSEKEVTQVFKGLQKVKDAKLEPQTVYRNNEVKDIPPFKLKFYEKDKQEPSETYGEALDKYFFTFEENMKKAKSQEKIEKIKSILQSQHRSIKQLEKQECENQEKAELLYNKYQEIDTLLKELNKISKKHTWKEIKEKLKGHKIIKEVLPKEKSVVIEI